MACRAPSNAGVLYITPYAVLGTKPDVAAADAILAEGIQLTSRGDGQVIRTEAESIEPGGSNPYLGSYGETLAFSVPVFIPGAGEAVDAHYMARIMRACGYAQVATSGELEWYRLSRACENITSGIRPVLVTWAQVDGSVHQLLSATGRVTISAESAGQPVMLMVELSGIPEAVISTPAGVPTPSPVYTAQGVPLSSRNATLTFGSSTVPRALYSVELEDGIAAEDQPSQLAARGFDSQMVRQTDVARLTLETVVTSGHALSMWTAFASQAADTLEWSVSGQAPSPILEIEAPLAFAGQPEYGDQGGARSLSVAWALLPDRSGVGAIDRAPFVIRLLEPITPS